ncbi:MAG: pyridoxal kinase [Alphaproteobacteria bacterium]|nr:pyridoxal kinase [Alphaproteobacteria bacterium]
MNVLLFNSHVVYGHVGAQAAVPALQRLGHAVWHVPTVLFSNHPAHGGFAGEVMPAARIADLLDGLAARGFLGQVDAVASGYLGSPETAEVVARAVLAVRHERPGALYACDPVLGDAGRLYVREGLLEAFRDRLLPLADLATPNRFELSLLSNCPIANLDDALAATRALGRQGPRRVACTSAVEDEREIGALLLGLEGAHLASTTRHPQAPHGAGDLFAALLLGWLLRGETEPAALGLAAAAAAAVIGASAGAKELALVASQDSLLQPIRNATMCRLA